MTNLHVAGINGAFGDYTMPWARSSNAAQCQSQAVFGALQALLPAGGRLRKLYEAINE